MNSAYGKTIKRIANTSDEVVDRDYLFGSLIANEYRNISYEDINDKQVLLKNMAIDMSSTTSIIGVMILSMSKRLMNMFISVLNDVGANIYYGDTDSIIFDASKIDEASALYQVRFDKPLIGCDLGYFHEDLEFAGYKNIKCRGGYFAGKKAYMLICSGVDSSGVVNDQLIHCRLKGVNSAGIEDHISKYPEHVKLVDRYLSMFTKMYSKGGVDFCLNPGDKASFKLQLGVGVRTRNEPFIRKLKFCDGDDDDDDDACGGDDSSE
jgi:hypothetical protein